MALRDAFVNIAQGAATAAVNRAVSSTVQGIASGLKRTNPTNATSALDSVIRSTDTILSYPEDVSVDEQQGHYVLFAFRKLQPGNLKPPKKTNKENLKKMEDDFGDVDLEFAVQGSSQLKVRNKSD